MTISDTNNCNDHLTNEHSEGTPDHDCSATKLLNDVERWRSGANVDEGGDQGDQKWVADRAELGEECGSVVEDEVDTSPEKGLVRLNSLALKCLPLLHHLDRCTKNCSSEVRGWVLESTLEAVGP